MKGSLSTRGATLVVVVLFTSLLLAVLLVVSSQLTLSSRRSVSDQRASLQAQYVAESGVTLARSRLRDVQGLLSASSLVVPNGTTGYTIRSYAERYCGTTTWTPNSDGTKLTCTVQSSSASDQFEVFAQFVTDAAYTALPGSERPTTLTAKRAFWKNLLSTTQQVVSNGATVNYRLSPTRVDRVNNSSYRFYLQLDTLNARGEQNGAMRVLKANRSNLTTWWVDVSLPNYLDNVLFTNHHRSLANANNPLPDVYFTTQAFDGPVHTNERFLFTSGATAGFAGRLSSAGCTDLPQVGMNSSGSCTQTPGVYVGSPTGIRAANTSDTTDVQKNATVLQKLLAGANPTLANVTREDGSTAKDATFTAAYRPMPTNANSQRAASQGVTPPGDVTTDPDEIARYTAGRGLYFGDEVQGITLWAGDANGNSPTSFTTNPKKWTPTPTYQYIRVLKGYVYQNNVQVPQYDDYRVDASGKLEQRNSNSSTNSNSWKTVPDPASPSNPRPFNGTIFGEKTIKNLSGPARYNNNLPAQPALAPFSQINVASEASNIEISGDLTLSDESCTKDLEACTQAGIDPPKNVLGVFTQKGSVVINQQAPNNVNIHAMLMSAEGQVTVDGYNSGTPRGTVNLVGGLVENWYGAFGTFNGTTSVSGYGRNFSHDRRFQNPGFGPPFAAVSPVWIKKDGSDDGLGLEDFLMQQGSKADLP